MIYPAIPQTETALMQAIDQEVHATGGLRITATLELVREITGYTFGDCLRPPTVVDSTIDQSATHKRSINGIASIEEISRSGIMIIVAGMDLRHFKRNPMVLASHRPITADLMPGAIGRVGSVAKKGNTLAFRNMTFDTDPLAEAWFQKIVNGFVRMVSVGIMPVDVEYVEETSGKGKNQKMVRYVRINTCELLEISPVAIGANHGAFIDPASLPRAASEEQRQQQIEKLLQDVARLQQQVDSDPGDGEYETFGDTSFPDAAFVVEKGAEKADGKTLQKFRHLPHHTKGVTSPTENSTVDLPHLRNALARVNQVKPVSEATESYRKRAEAHLRKHANVLLDKSREAFELLHDFDEAGAAGNRKLLELAGEFTETP